MSAPGPRAKAEAEWLVRFANTQRVAAAARARCEALGLGSVEWTPRLGVTGCIILTPTEADRLIERLRVCS